MKKLLCLLLAVLTALSLASCGGRLPEYEDFPSVYTDALPPNAEEGLTFHAFNWTYSQIKENLAGLAYAGFKNVLTMPVQQPKSGGSAWWAFYQPLSFSIADNSPLGSKEDLISLCSEAEKYGICILADVVVNHMATTDDEGKEPDGTPTVSPAVAEYEPVLYANRNEDTDGNGVTFHHNKGASGSGGETQFYPWGNLPDLDTSNPYVQQRVLSLLKECIDAGIDGFRFDAAKHVETSSDPQYPSDFWENTLVKAKEYYRQKTGKELYAYGEILGSPQSRDISLYTRYMRVTDDGFASQLKPMYTKKDASVITGAMLKTSDPSQLIAWVESHDEYVTSNTHYSDVRIARYWSVIAVKNGLGGLYLGRPDDALTVGKIGSYAFESEYTAVCNRFRNRFYDAESYEAAMGSIYVCEKVKDNDQGALILNLDEVDTEQMMEVSVPHLDDGNYYDALTGEKVVVHKHTAHIRFEANGMAFITRTPGVHPTLKISERSCVFSGQKTVEFSALNCEEGWYRFEGENEKHPIDGKETVDVSGHVKDGKAVLEICLINGPYEKRQSFTYTEAAVIEGRFNVLNLNEKYLGGDYEIYIWSWNPGRWSRDYEIVGSTMLVDTSGMQGFLIGIFPAGYEIRDPNNWDSNIIKQSADIKGSVLEQGFCDMSDF